MNKKITIDSGNNLLPVIQVMACSLFGTNPTPE